MIPFFKRNHEKSDAAREHLADTKARLKELQRRAGSQPVTLVELFADIAEEDVWPSDAIAADGRSMAELVVNDLAAENHELTSKNGGERVA